MDKFVNPYTDFGFKILFGTEINKELLISFVNSILNGREVIKDLTYLNSEHLGTTEKDRRAVFDVYCENEKGEKILIEMQKAEQMYFKDRSVYYSTFPIREQGKKGEWNYGLKAVYIISILNFRMDEKNDKCFHHEVKLVDLMTNEVFYDKLTFVYLEMPKFNKSENELSGMFDKWMFVLRNLSRLMDRPATLQERVFTKLFDSAEIARFNKVQQEEYEDSLKVYRDWKNTLETAELKAQIKGMAQGRAQGLAEGRAEGRAQGRAEGRAEGQVIERVENAKKLKQLGVSVEIISQATGLSQDEIATI